LIITVLWYDINDEYYNYHTIYVLLYSCNIIRLNIIIYIYMALMNKICIRIKLQDLYLIPTARFNGVKWNEYVFEYLYWELINGSHYMNAGIETKVLSATNILWKCCTVICNHKKQRRSRILLNHFLHFNYSTNYTWKIHY